MGMCAMYSFKYGPRSLHPNYDDQDSLRGGASSDRKSILESKQGKEDANRFDQHPALWKRTIPKGRRCEPLDFSGVILYDENGNRLHQYTPNHYPHDRPSALA